MIHILNVARYFLVNCMALATITCVWWKIEISWKVVAVRRDDELFKETTMVEPRNTEPKRVKL